MNTKLINFSTNLQMFILQQLSKLSRYSVMFEFWKLIKLGLLGRIKLLRLFLLLIRVLISRLAVSWKWHNASCMIIMVRKDKFKVLNIRKLVLVVILDVLIRVLVYKYISKAIVYLHQETIVEWVQIQKKNIAQIVMKKVFQIIMNKKFQIAVKKLVKKRQVRA